MVHQVGAGCDDGILLRQHDNHLAPGAVGTVAANSVAPGLIAIAGNPVVPLDGIERRLVNLLAGESVGIVVDMLAGLLLDPFGADELFSVPTALQSLRTK